MSGLPPKKQLDTQRSVIMILVKQTTPLVEAMRGTLSEVGMDPSRVKRESLPGYDR